MNVTTTDAVFIQAVLIIFMLGMVLQRIINVERYLKDIDKKQYPERITKLETEVRNLKARHP